MVGWLLRCPRPRPVGSSGLTQSSASEGLLSRRGLEQGFYLPARPLGPLRRFWTLETQRIIPATALMHDLRKRINAQRLGLSTCKAGALPTELRPRALMSIVLYRTTRKNCSRHTHSESRNRTALTQRLLGRGQPPTNHVAALGTSGLRAMRYTPRQLFGGRLVDLIEKRSELGSFAPRVRPRPGRQELRISSRPY